MLNKELLKRMFNFTDNKRETIKIAMLMIFKSLPYTILYPIILSKTVDYYIPNKNINTVIILSIILIFVYIINFVLDLYTETHRKNCYFENDMQIKQKVFDTIQNADISELDKIETGRLFQITTSQAFESSQLFVWNFVGFFAVRLRGIVYAFIVMLFIDWKMALVILLIFVFSYIILIPFYNKNMQIYKKLQNTIIVLQEKVNEYIDSYSTTKTLRLEEINISDIEKILNKSKAELINSNKILELHSAFFSLLTFLSIIAVLVIGGNQIIIGVGVGSTIILVIDYINNINNHMKNLLEHAHGILNKYNCFINILDIINIKEEEKNGSKKLEKITSIKFENTRLSYDEKNIILDDINLNISKKMTIAIVGKSGAGKTSLVNLIPRFYKLTSGKILINDIDYTEYNLESLRSKISYVFQEPVILNMSIKDNLMYGNNANFDEVVNICKKIGIDEKIRSFDDGYDTLINAQTDFLSFGEKQLLSFARAILKNGDLVILDEVTSNLDLEFEKNIIVAMNEILKNKISFVIAHRLNTIMNADLIVYLENGVIKEMGNHDELMKKKGYYFKLYSSK